MSYNPFSKKKQDEKFPPIPGTPESKAQGYDDLPKNQGRVLQPKKNSQHDVKRAKAMIRARELVRPVQDEIADMGFRIELIDTREAK